MRSASRLVGIVETRTSIDRPALLRDVQAGHDLHARHDRAHELPAGPPGNVELPVDAVANEHLFLFRLDVDVARPALYRLLEQTVDPADDRSVLVRLQDVDGVVLLERLVRLELAARLLALVNPVDRVDHHFRRRHARFDGLAERGANVVEAVGVQRIGTDHLDVLVLLRNNQDLVALRVANRQPGRELRGNGVHVDALHEREPALGGQRPRHVVLRRGLGLDQQIQERRAALALLLVKRLQRVRAQHTVPDQNAPEGALLEHGSLAPVDRHRTRDRIDADR